MALTKVPCCFYPSKILIVDDRPDFTKWMALKFKSYGACEVFNDGLSALTALENYHPQNFMNRMSTKSEFDFLINPEHKNIEINLENIQKEASRGHNDEISVAIIDYDMPRMNGMELCKALKKLPMKKIMLTGEADHKLAVEAFNGGLIDRFILKNSANVIEIIEQAVFELQVAYFYELSKAIAENPQEDVESQIICLTDLTFAKHFFALVKKYDICEFYLLNHFGDFLLIDRNHQSYELGVRDQHAIAGLHNLAQDLYNQEPDGREEILNEVLSCKRVPFFPKEFNEYISLADWPPYFREVVELKGDKNTYYCAFFPLLNP
jgi:CheY-like chemotaxis protein